jgi:hypothetical protein
MENGWVSSDTQLQHLPAESCDSENKWQSFAFMPRPSSQTSAKTNLSLSDSIYDRERLPPALGTPFEELCLASNDIFQNEAIESLESALFVLCREYTMKMGCGRFSLESILVGHLLDTDED